MQSLRGLFSPKREKQINLLRGQVAVCSPPGIFHNLEKNIEIVYFDTQQIVADCKDTCVVSFSACHRTRGREPAPVIIHAPLNPNYRKHELNLDALLIAAKIMMIGLEIINVEVTLPSEFTTKQADVHAKIQDLLKEAPELKINSQLTITFKQNSRFASETVDSVQPHLKI